MRTGRYNASALCLQSGPEAVLVVGGRGTFLPVGYGDGNGLFSSLQAPQRAELLIHKAGAQGGEGAWRWRQLNKMHEHRSHRPGMLLLQAGGARQRVLVAGGGRSSTAEILQLSCIDPSDRGQWTLIAPLSALFCKTSLVECSNRIFAIGSFFACIVPSFSRDFLLHLFGLLGGLRNVNELITSAPGQHTVRKILRSRIPFSVTF